MGHVLHASKNGPGMNAASVAGGINHQKVWWKCEKVWWKCDRGPDHEWVASIVSRTRQGGSGCPFCTCHQASVTNWLATLHPEIAAQLHPTLNTPGVDASKILPGSGMKYTWLCPASDEPGLDPARLLATTTRRVWCVFGSVPGVAGRAVVGTGVPHVGGECPARARGEQGPRACVEGE
eukprot:jgi/Mesvir1/7524/Mv19274-RA.1